MNKHKRGARLVGLLVGLLAARLIALLLAARPDNPAINLLLTLTAPLTAPFQFLDQLARQPQFGARLELATLAALALAIGIAAVVQWVLLSHSPRDREDNHAQS
jgi:NhaP-type Na+/H+ or K+/H+ antiporter